MRKKVTKKLGLRLFLVLGICVGILMGALCVRAGTEGFVTKGQKTYYMDADGKRHKGWLTLDGKKYYFDKKTGVQAKGWQYDSAKKKIRYFSAKTGAMLTGWHTNQRGVTRFFRKKNGRMSEGLKKIGKYYYFFRAGSGARCENAFRRIENKQYYFDEKGHAVTGWQTIQGKRYYFTRKGVMYADRTATIGKKNYCFSSTGVASEIDYEMQGNAVQVYDRKNKRYYRMAREYVTHPGIADGSLSDRELLAAICDAEANDQGLIGMEAVALCILNRTLKKDKEFPSSLRHVIYQTINSTSTPHYTPVRNGALLRRLNGRFEDRKTALQAADAALKIFKKHVNHGKPRKLSGFKKDFNYMYFMMHSDFWSQPLNFGRVEYVSYRGHIFFVDWV